MFPVIIKEILASEALAVASLSAQLGYPASENEIAARLQQLNKSINDAVYGAYQNNKLTGWIHVFKTLRLESGMFCEIGALVTDENERSKGLGRLLVGQAITWSREQGVQVLRVRSNIIRKDAHRFYLSNAFRDLKDQKVFEIKI